MNMAEHLKKIGTRKLLTTISTLLSNNLIFLIFQFEYSYKSSMLICIKNKKHLLIPKLTNKKIIQVFIRVGQFYTRGKIFFRFYWA